MAISGVNDGNREHEMYQRRLRELGENVSKQTQELQKHHKENVDAIKNQQKETLKAIREKTDQQMRDQAVEQQRQSERLSDRFEKQSFYDSKKAYDRFGRAQEDAHREMQDLKTAHKSQVDSVVEAKERTVDNLRRSQEEELYRVKRSNDNVNFRINNDADDKLNKQAEGFQNQAIEMTRKFGEEMHKKEYENFQNLNSAKATGNLRLEQLDNQRRNEVQNLRNAFSLREKQLVDEKNLRETKMAQSGNDSLKQYQQRLGDNFARTVAENNYANAQKDSEYAATLAQQTHEHRAKEQMQKMALERQLAEAQVRNEARSDQDKLQSDMARRRALHEGHLESEMTKKRYEDSIAAMKQDNRTNLASQQTENQRNFDKLRMNMNERLTKMEKDRFIGDREKEMKNLDSSTSASAKHAAERARITSAYEAKQRALEDRAALTEKNQSQQLFEEKTKLRQEKEATIAEANIENVDKLMKQRLRYETINSMQERETKHKIATLDKQNTLRSENVRKNYVMTLGDLEKHYQEQMDELRREDALLLAKVRAEYDTQLKNQQFDSDFKIKSMAQTYESRIFDMQQANEREVNVLKADMERMQRSMAKRHKDEIDALIESNRKALALQEQQFKEKFRIQEDNHKQDVARMRHSNELLRQKS